MSLMKKIVLIFVSVTVISSVAFGVLGNSMIEQASSGELDRGPGRANAVISKFNGEISKINAKSMEFANYYEIKDKLILENKESYINEILNIEKKAEMMPISNMMLLDSEFKLLKTLKEKDKLEGQEIDFLQSTTKNLLNEKENVKKGFFSGIVRSNDYPYIIGAKKIRGNSENTVLVIERIDKDFIERLAGDVKRNIDIVNYKSIKNHENADLVKVHIYDREYYCNRKEETIDIYTELDAIDQSDEKYFIKLIDDREVRNSVEHNVYMLVSLMVFLTITSNLIIYCLIKKNVITRILKIKTVVKGVSEGSKLEVKLDGNTEGDEIATLNSDLNEMFRHLKNYSDNLEFVSRHDTLTNLSNRYSINNYITTLTKNNEEFALFFIDLDNFKVINDTLGHDIGDKLLVMVANELNNATKDDESLTVGRFGGDEFIIVRKGKNSKEEVEKLAKDILMEINKCYEIKSCLYEIKASMGISFFPEHSVQQGQVLQYSDIAMYCSKREGGNNYKIFEEVMIEPLKIEKMLKKAIEKEEFEIYLQPIFSITNNTVAGCEALIRWKIDGEIITPNKFIPLAKRTGDIAKIDNLVFKKAVESCRELLDKGEKDFYISINTSKLFLKQVDLISFMENTLKEFNVESKYIKLEVTEDEIIDDVEYTINLLKKIRATGIEIYLDDFGVGYSSFSHIKVLPIDVIKIDRSLLLDIDKNSKSQQIVKTMIILAHSLNMGIICEGIEEKGQVEILKLLNCDNIQGYYYSRPLEKGSFINYIKNIKNG